MELTYSGGIGAGIVGAGCYVPAKKLTNFDLEKMVDTNDEWIMQRTGIKERRIIGEGETTASIATQAARAALADAGTDGSGVGLVIVATSTPDGFTPPAAAIVQHAIGAARCAAFDISAGCTGSLYAMALAEQAVRCGSCEQALVIGAETLSRAVDWQDRRTCVVFGDGAGAVLIGKAPEGRGFLSSLLLSDGAGADLITMPAFSISDADLERRGGEKKPTVWMDGAKVMKFASRAMVSALEAVAAKAGVAVSDIDLVIPHQANKRIIDNAAGKLGLRDGQLFVNIDKYGNTSAASIPLAICEASAKGRIASGDCVALVAFGAGLLYGAAVMRWI